MPVQATLNLPVRKTRLRSKLAVKTEDVSEKAANVKPERPGRRLRSKTEENKSTPVKTPVKRASPIKESGGSPNKRPVDLPEGRNVHAVRNLFSSPNRAINVHSNVSCRAIEEASIALRSSPRKVLRARNDSDKKSIDAESPVKCRSPTKSSNRKENQENEPVNVSPKKTRSPTKSVKAVQVTKADSTLYTRARHSLHTQLTDVIVGRDDEITKLSSIIEPALQKNKSTSLYVSGAPGTGKTVSLTHILEKLSGSYKFLTVFINCMTVKNVSAIYAKISEGLSFKESGLEGVQEGVKKRSCVIVLDEVDQLQSHNQQILYSLFELPKLKDSKVVLIGIANALDLTDKTVPLLQAYGCRPHIHNFAPYSDKQIVAILKSRLSDCGTIIKPMALTFLAKKIATCTGDVRKALDICRRSIEIVERQVRQQRILASKTHSEAQPSSVIVDISHISQVMSDVFNTRARGSQDLHTTLPLQQKLLLCSLLVIIKRKKLKEITMGKLQEVYGRVCKLSKVSPIDYSELQSICTLLESRALVSIKKSKESRQSKVRLAVDEAEVEQVLQDQTILAICMTETSIC